MESIRVFFFGVAQLGWVGLVVHQLSRGDSQSYGSNILGI